MTRRAVQLMRMTLKTDRRAEDPENYWGSFSDPFMVDDASQEVVAVDWSVPGEVTVTLLTPSTRG